MPAAAAVFTRDDGGGFEAAGEVGAVVAGEEQGELFYGAQEPDLAQGLQDCGAGAV